MILGAASAQTCLNALPVTAAALDQTGLLETAMTFPFNAILATALVLVIAAAASLTRKPKNPVKKEIPNPEIELPRQFDEEIPRHFQDYRDGVTKLYDWLYRFAQSRITAIRDNMTPRDLQQTIARNIPPDGAQALETLITNYEIAVYSDNQPTKQMLENTLRSVERLRRLIQSRNQEAQRTSSGYPTNYGHRNQDRSHRTVKNLKPL